MPSIADLEAKESSSTLSSEGWVNATSLASTFNKGALAWVVYPDSIIYMAHMSLKLGFISPSDLSFISKELDSIDIDPSSSIEDRLLKCFSLSFNLGLIKMKSECVWIHPSLTRHFSRWLDIPSLVNEDFYHFSSKGA